MGQGASSQRQAQGLDSADLTLTARRYEELAEAGDGRQDRETLLGGNDTLHQTPLHSPTTSRHGTTSSRQSGYHSTYRRETRARSTLISGGNGSDETDTHGRDDVVLEQEERPLILRDMEVRLNDAPITDIQAAPMPRRGSILSRFGSRITRRSAARPRDLGATTLEGALEGPVGASTLHTAMSRGLHDERDDGGRRNRFSMFDFPTRSLRTSRQTSRNRPSSFVISPPFAEYSTDPEVAFSEDPILVPESDTDPQSRLEANRAGTSSRSHRARSFRRSLVAPISQILQSTRSRQQRDQSSSQRQVQIAEETTNLISPQGTGADASVNEQPSFNIHRGVAEEGSVENPVELDSPDRPTSWLPSPRARPRSGLTRDRPTSLLSGPSERPSSWISGLRDRPHSWMSTSSESSTREGRRRGRRLSNLLRDRSSRLIRREDDTPLSRVLQLAAAAIAAQLSGTTDASSTSQSVGDDHFDGNLNSFIQSLNTAAEASASADEDTNMSNLPPLNFWRVFRFVNSAPNNVQNSAGSEGAPSRLVTLVVVGVRSVPSSSLLNDTAGALEPNLDGILALPPTTPERSAGASSPDTELDTPSSSGFLRRNRTPSTGFSSLPSLNESPRSPGLLGSRLNRSTARNPLRRSSGLNSSPVSNRPPSPFPDTFTGRNREGISGDGLVDAPSTPSTSSGDASSDSASNGAIRRSEPGPSSIRQRPRSESHGHLGSGAARRNGVVEPDTVSSNGRHWLIYVVGTNLSEDHPAFQAPSLFTDNPSYEDMLMLSALLGPAKPPVASAQDVAIANGVYRLESRRADGQWMARLMDRVPGNDGVPSPLIEMPAEIERCLVCLTDYEIGEEIRQIQNCNHVFHRECVDTWLTTGRNSCPLCRGNGVEEKSNPAREDQPGVESTAA